MPGGGVQTFLVLTFQIQMKTIVSPYRLGTTSGQLARKGRIQTGIRLQDTQHDWLPVVERGHTWVKGYFPGRYLETE